MSIAIVAHTAAIQTPDYTSNTTTSAIDTTGASLIVIGLSVYGGFYSGFTSFTDSKGNAWTALTSYIDGGNDEGVQLFYCSNPTVGSGHTFSINVSGLTVASFYVAAFSGIATSSAFDKQSGDLFVTSVQPGSLTATAANSLYVTIFCGGYAGGTSSGQFVDSSFTITDKHDAVAGQCVSGALAYKISSAAENPAWTITSGGNIGASMAVFAPASGGGGPTYTLTAANGSFVLTGEAITLRANRKLIAAHGTFGLTGEPVTLRANRKMIAGQGSISLSGQAAAFVRSYYLAAAVGMYALTGEAVTLRANRKLTAGTGTIAITGNATSVFKAYVLALGAGTIALTGEAVRLARGWRLALGDGSFGLTGKPVTLTYSGVTRYVLAAATGFISLVGKAMAFARGNFWTPQTDGSPFWIPQTDNSDPWTKQTP